MAKQTDQYTVRADPETGEWIGEPKYVGKVDLAEWLRKEDTEEKHFDTYEVPDDGSHTTTRAIEVVWAR